MALFPDAESDYMCGSPHPDKRRDAAVSKKS